MTPLTFAEQRSPGTSVDIDVEFVTRTHPQDTFPFDGRGGVLAHAFYPLNGETIRGDAHFDDDDLFSKTTGVGEQFTKNFTSQGSATCQQVAVRTPLTTHLLFEDHRGSLGWRSLETGTVPPCG